MKFIHFHSRKCIWKCRLWNGGHFVSPSVYEAYPVTLYLMIFDEICQMIFDLMISGELYQMISDKIYTCFIIPSTTKLLGGGGILVSLCLSIHPTFRTRSVTPTTLVQVMAWCHQATSHYLSPCWPRSMLPYGATRPHRVDPLSMSFHHNTVT